MAWEVGDLALCLEAKNGCLCLTRCPAPDTGTISTVAEVFETPLGLSLNFVEICCRETETHYAGFNAECFRKVIPYQQRFARELKACRPVTIPKLLPIPIKVRKLSPEWNTP
jgi:hypothetical protein